MTEVVDPTKKKKSNVFSETPEFEYDSQQADADLEKYGAGMNAAQTAALDRLRSGASGAYSQEQFQQAIDYYSKPTLDAAKKRQTQLTNQMRAQGLFNAGAHTTALREDFEGTERQISENLTVPLMLEQIKAKETAAQANIDQAAAVGAQGYQSYLAGRGQAYSEYSTSRQQHLTEINAAMERALGAATATGSYVDPETGLSYQTLAAQAQAVNLEIAQRGMKLSEEELDVKKGEFAATLNLSRDQLNEAIDARKAGNNLDNQQIQNQVDQFMKTYGLQAQAQALTVAEFEQKKVEFAAQLGLSKEQLEEAIAARKAGNELDNQQLQAQVDQFNQTYGLQAQAQRLTEAEFAQKKVEFAAQLGLSQAQLEEAIIARKAGNTLDNQQLQAQIDQFNQTYTLQQAGQRLSEAELAEKQRAFDAELAQRRSEFSQQTGLTQQQLDEEIRRNQAGEAYQNTALAQQLNTFTAELKQREAEFNQTYGLQAAELTGTYAGEATMARRAQDIDTALRSAQLTGKFIDPANPTGPQISTLEFIASEREALNDKYSRAQMEAAATGAWTDPEGIDTLQTLQAKIADLQAQEVAIAQGNLDMNWFQAKLEERAARAEKTGIWTDEALISDLREMLVSPKDGSAGLFTEEEFQAMIEDLYGPEGAGMNNGAQVTETPVASVPPAGEVETPPEGTGTDQTISPSSPNISLDYAEAIGAGVNQQTWMSNFTNALGATITDRAQALGLLASVPADVKTVLLAAVNQKFPEVTGGVVVNDAVMTNTNTGAGPTGTEAEPTNVGAITGPDDLGTTKLSVPSVGEVTLTNFAAGLNLSAARVQELLNSGTINLSATGELRMKDGNRLIGKINVPSGATSSGPTSSGTAAAGTVNSLPDNLRQHLTDGRLRPADVATVVQVYSTRGAQAAMDELIRIADNYA